MRETILEKLKTDLQEAVKKGEKLRVSTLRFLLAALHNEKIRQQKDLAAEEILAVIQKQMKIRQEAIGMFKKGQRDDLVEKESQELKILKSYLPQQMSEEEIRAVVKGIRNQEPASAEASAGGSEIRNFGKLMGEVMAQVKGRAQGALVAKIVREELGN